MVIIRRVSGACYGWWGRWLVLCLRILGFVNHLGSHRFGWTKVKLVIDRNGEECGIPCEFVDLRAFTRLTKRRMGCDLPVLR